MIGVGTSLWNRFLAGGGAWSPLTLFAAGEEGVWYDPSDLSTLYQDITGSTPVTAVEQPVGLILDKSNGLILGDDLGGQVAKKEIIGSDSGTYPDGTFLCRRNGTGTINIGAEITGLTLGVPYKITVTITNEGSEAGNALIIAAVRADGTDNYFTVGENSTKTVYYKPSASYSNGMRFICNPGNSCLISGISIKALPGNHAAQATTTRRPILRARYNLLTYSEQFDNAAWTKTNATVTANAAVAPDGTTTADAVAPNSGAVVPYIYQTYTTSAIAFSVSFYAKANGYSFVQLSDGVSVSDYCNFDLETGAVGASVNYTGSITDVGGGWYRCIATKTFTAASTEIRIEPLPSNLTARRPSFNADGTSGIYIWGAQVNYGSNATEYQRIAAATDYDTDPTKFPKYLDFDGVDDVLVSSAIDFSATDKMSLFVGINKRSNALGCVVGLSNSIATDSNSFEMASPSSGGTSYRSRLGFQGSAFAYRQTDDIDIAPIRLTFAGVHDAATPSTTLLRNNVNQTTGADASGIAGFANAALYIGMRGAVMVPFTGYIYSLIVRGALSDATEIRNAEAYVNSKTGAY